MAIVLVSLLPLIIWIVSKCKTRYIDRTLILYSEQSGYDYVLRLPKSYSKSVPKPPLIVYLHGSGELGKNVRNLMYCDL